MKDKFIIEVSNELDSEYIQKLAFKGGYKWRFTEGVATFKPTLLNFNWRNQMEITHGDSTGAPLYSFPSQASEIVALFTKKEESFKEDDWIYCLKELRMESDDRVEATKGKVYKCIGSGGGSYSYIDNSGNRHGMAHDDGYFRLATKEEIESHLISEAEKKGFVKGTKVVQKNFRDHQPLEIESLCYKFDYGVCVQYTDGGFDTLESVELAPSYPFIRIGAHRVKFEDNHIMVGCTKVTVSQIKEIAEYYNQKN